MSSWRDALRPILETSVADASPSTAYLRQVDDFVIKLDAFVKLLERDTGRKSCGCDWCGAWPCF